jgi:PST family polysaccharide transporter
MINSYKSTIKRNIKFVENLSYLSLLQLFTLLVPFIVYPYVIRIVGAEYYGAVVFAQSIMAYFSLMIECGFNMSSVKRISERVSDIEKISEIVSTVLLLKFFIWLICIAILIVLMLTVPEIRDNKLLYLFTFTITFHDFLFPQFFFQGTEKMKYITIINISIRTLFLIAVFFVIKEPTDYLKIPLLNGIGAFLGGLVGLYIIFAKEKVRFIFPSFGAMLLHLKESVVIFSTKLSYYLRDKTAIVLIGALFSKTIVAYFDLAIKLANVFMKIYSSIPQAILPRLTQSKSVSFAKQIFRLTLISGFIYAIGITLFSKYIVLFLAGNEMMPAQPFVMLMSITCIFSTLNFLLNYYMVLNSESKKMLYSSFYSMLFFAMSLPLLLISKNSYFLVVIFIVSLAVESIYKLYIFKKNKTLSKWVF